MQPTPNTASQDSQVKGPPGRRHVVGEGLKHQDACSVQRSKSCKVRGIMHALSINNKISLQKLSCSSRMVQLPCLQLTCKDVQWPGQWHDAGHKAGQSLPFQDHARQVWISGEAASEGHSGNTQGDQNLFLAKFIIVKYIIQFLGLSWHPGLTKFMSDHMVEDPRHKMEGDLHAQSVNSSAKADQWRSKLTQAQLAELDTVCGETIERHQEMRMTGQTWTTGFQSNKHLNRLSFPA